jgi:hypothetical protein
MLHLIQHHKTRKALSVADGDHKNFRLLLRHSEDTLTSSVFSRISYLSTEIVWSIFQIASRHSFFTELPTPGDFTDILFWPHWNPLGTSNVLFVEPDVLLRFERVDILVEAKKHDDRAQQQRSQLTNEAKSYLNVFGHQQKKVLVLAVGGVLGLSEDALLIDGFEQVIPLACIRWRDLQFAVQRELTEIKRRLSSVSFSATRRALEDVLLAFHLHDYFTGVLLDTLPTNYTVNRSFINTFI